jgi:hypothetical protein
MQPQISNPAWMARGRERLAARPKGFEPLTF